MIQDQEISQFCDFENDPRFKSVSPCIQKLLDYFKGKRKNIHNPIPVYSNHHNAWNGSPCCFDMYIPSNDPVIWFSPLETNLKFSCFSCGKKYSEIDIQQSRKKESNIENFYSKDEIEVKPLEVWSETTTM
jgi:hypothetical protein